MPQRTYADGDREKIMHDVRAALWTYGDMKSLSDFTGISVSCLHSLRAGRTLWPRPHTLFLILPYLGLELRLVRANEMIRPT